MEGDYVTVQLPEQMAILPSQLLCLPVACQQWIGNSLLLTPVANGVLDMQISGLMTPKANPSQPLTITTFTDDSYMLARYHSPVWAASCALPCRSCSPDSPSACLSCYSDPSITTHSLFDSQNSLCLDQCLPQFLVSPSGSECIPCDPSCLSCAVFDSNCTACSAPLLLLDNSCLPECPPYFYPATTVCSACMPPC